jgi:hypothetical protein
MNELTENNIENNPVYRVEFTNKEEDIQDLLNKMDAEGYDFNSLETEYTMYIVIFKKKLSSGGCSTCTTPCSLSHPINGR